MKALFLSVFCSISILFFENMSFATDTLVYNESLSDSQTLVSSNQVFELGFFSPGNSKSRYLGIWYKDIPYTFVWVANRDRPITDLSGVLVIRNNTDLVLLNGNGTVFWSSKSSTGANNLVAQILDDGNFVLREANADNSENHTWQSFDHPTDTLLPGMKLGLDLKTGLNRNLTSWKSLDDPSQGDYSYSVEINGVAQIVLWKNSTVLSRSGLWYEDQFIGNPVLSPNSVFKPRFVSNSEEVYYAIENVNIKILSRLVMSQSAVVQHLYWINDQHKWVDLFTIPKDRCDTYNLCGPYAVCDINGSPNCNCMLGFDPKSAHDWELFVTFGGCVAKSPLDCGEGEGFVKYEGMKLPDASSLWMNGSILGSDECEDICLKNCSCTGYSVINSNTGGNQKACFAWSGDLIDNREADNGHGQDLYVRLSASSLKLIDASRKRRRRKRRLIVIIAVSVLSVSFLFGLIFWFIIWLKRKTGTREGAQVNIAERNHHVENYEEDVEFPSFDLGTIVKATNEFSFSNKIGEGGFGPVYKGVLPSGQEIAVKKLSLDSRQGFIELKNEVILISKLQHRNLVRLLGCCIHGEERMLIYEFMPNKSLDSFIFDKRRGSKLKWNLRYNIIMGIARGLLYLHQDSRLRIIHRDLKASNILLDKDMNPKISDFGLARSFGGDQTEEKTRMVVGTYGYMSPEYAVDGNFSVKSDVFSFGVLVLEIVSGRRNRGFCHDEHDLNLLGHAWKLWDEGKVMELLDLSMEGNYTVHEAVRCIHVGLLCVQKRAEDRPIMSSVLTMLDGGGPMLPEPKQPGFFTERGLSTETDSSSRQIQHVSSDQVSISTVQGR